MAAATMTGTTTSRNPSQQHPNIRPSLLDVMSSAGDRGSSSSSSRSWWSQSMTMSSRNLMMDDDNDNSAEEDEEVYKNEDEHCVSQEEEEEEEAEDNGMSMKFSSDTAAAVAAVGASHHHHHKCSSTTNTARILLPRMSVKRKAASMRDLFGSRARRDDSSVSFKRAAQHMQLPSSSTSMSSASACADVLFNNDTNMSFTTPAMKLQRRGRRSMYPTSAVEAMMDDHVTSSSAAACPTSQFKKSLYQQKHEGIGVFLMKGDGATISTAAAANHRNRYSLMGVVDQQYDEDDIRMPLMVAPPPLASTESILLYDDVGRMTQNHNNNHDSDDEEEVEVAAAACCELPQFRRDTIRTPSDLALSIETFRDSLLTATAATTIRRSDVDEEENASKMMSSSWHGL
jgi:hypothetical protein